MRCFLVGLAVILLAHGQDQGTRGLLIVAGLFVVLWLEAC